MLGPGRALALLLLLGAGLAEAAAADRLPPPRRYPRGGSASATATELLERQRGQRQRAAAEVHPLKVAARNVTRGLGEVGDRLHAPARALAARLPRLPFLPRKPRRSCRRLDEACRAFAPVLRPGGEVDVARLLAACRAHLGLMRSGGAALRVVAQDLESNVKKAEKVFKKTHLKSLSSLLEYEKTRGIHNGSELHNHSAAMGLLWIRRSLAFQRDLYAALVADAVHPREAARAAYAARLAPFHGWALGKVFPASLAQMPARDAFVAKCGGIAEEELDAEEEREIVGRLRALTAAWGPLLAAWERDFARLGLEDTRRA